MLVRNSTVPRLTGPGRSDHLCPILEADCPALARMEPVAVKWCWRTSARVVPTLMRETPVKPSQSDVSCGATARKQSHGAMTALE
jgi:hypothetical protein